MKRRRRLLFLCGVMLASLFQGCNPTTPAPTYSPVEVPTPTSNPPTPTTPERVPVLGIAYSPYRDCQAPTSEDQPSIEDVKQDLQIIRTMANGIRTYSSVGINARIPALANELGLTASAGAWLTSDKVKNELEINGLIDLAQNTDLESVIVGNEVLLRGDLSEDELIGHIHRVKQAVNVPVTTAEIGGILLAHPRVMDAVDFEMVHLYPFWGGASVNGAAQSVMDQYQNIVKQSNGKRVVIGETGWPSAGPTIGTAVPNPENQAQFSREFLTLAIASKIDFYYFDAFDEMWKTEGGVGSYWGLLDSNRVFKAGVRSVMVSPNVELQPSDAKVGFNGTQAATPQMTRTSGGLDEFYVYSNFFDEKNHFAPGGWMGDLDAINITTCYRDDLPWPKTFIQASYSPSEADSNGWAGIYWLQPDGNWGTLPKVGFDLSKYKQLVFHARAEVSGTQIKFLVGGVAKTNSDVPSPLPYPSSIKTPIFAQEADPADGFINLSDSWEEYHIDLSTADLSYVIDGFGWAAERARTPEGATFYLDDIRFITPQPERNIIPPLHIYSGRLLRTGLNMGVDSSGHLYQWVQNLIGTMQVSYPPSQAWGVVFITVGNPSPRGSRQSLDLSQYRYLSLEMRSESEGQSVLIGIKDRNQPDDGSETLVPVNVSTSWETYTFDLQQFTKANLSKIYIPFELVFHDYTGKAIYFRNVQYLP